MSKIKGHLRLHEEIRTAREGHLAASQSGLEEVPPRRLAGLKPLSKYGVRERRFPADVAETRSTFESRETPLDFIGVGEREVRVLAGEREDATSALFRFEQPAGKLIKQLVRSPLVHGAHGRILLSRSELEVPAQYG